MTFNKYQKYGKKYYNNHKESCLKRSKTWQKNNPLKVSAKNRKYRLKYPERQSKRSSLWYRKNRLELIDKFGGKCVKCGFSDIRSLQLDHIMGGGQKERKTTSPNAVVRYYLVNFDLVGYKLQVLCANCNWIKKWDNKEGVKY